MSRCCATPGKADAMLLPHPFRGCRHLIPSFAHIPLYIQWPTPQPGGGDHPTARSVQR